MYVLSGPRRETERDPKTSASLVPRPSNREGGGTGRWGHDPLHWRTTLSGAPFLPSLVGDGFPGEYSLTCLLPSGAMGSKKGPVKGGPRSLFLQGLTGEDGNWNLQTWGEGRRREFLDGNNKVP